MPLNARPYINFDGHAEEAINFYRRAVGAEITALMRCKEAPEGSGPTPLPQFAEKILHAEIRIGDSTLMVSDGYNSGKPAFAGVTIALQAKDAAEAERLFNALVDGGQVHMPLSETFFATRFGMLADKFGLSWMINLPKA